MTPRGGLYGARKVWWQLQAEGVAVARCTVERLMRQAGLAGVVRGQGAGAPRSPTSAPIGPTDLVERDFTATAPNRLWVADFTYVATWSGVVYVAFVIDVFSRRIVGWKADTNMRTGLVLDTLEMALWSRERAGLPAGAGLIHHHDNGSQYLSFAFTQRLIDAGVDASVGIASATPTTTPSPRRRSACTRPRRSAAKARGRRSPTSSWPTLEWVDWFNTTRLHSACGRLSPAQFEQQVSRNSSNSITTASNKPGAVHEALRGSLVLARLIVLRKSRVDLVVHPATFAGFA